MLKSRTTWPPGGWLYLEAATGWRAPKGLTFDQVVKEIIQHRKRNQQYKLTTNHDEVAEKLDDYTCARLKYDPAWCAAGDSQQVRNFTVALPRPAQPVRPGNVAAGARFLANTTAGIKVWLDWFGDGRPVQPELATKRADICVKCVENKKGNLLDWFTGLAAQEIMAIFSALNDLNLHTPLDDQLNVCKACRCPLKAKIWAPLGIIMKNMAEETTKSLDPGCWILHETE